MLYKKQIKKINCPFRKKKYAQLIFEEVAKAIPLRRDSISTIGA